MPYDKEFIERMRGSLLEEKNSLEKELLRFARPTEGEGNYEMIEENLGDDMEDAATEAEINSNNRPLEQSLEAKLKDVLEALQKIETGTYGVCEKTGREIPKERLEALPMARVCADV